MDKKSAENSNNLFLDPPNVQEVIAKFPKGPPNSILAYVEKVLPGWVVKSSPQFSHEIAKFNYQWAEVCVKLKVVPQTVLLVKCTYIKDPQRQLAQYACQLLNEQGFVVVDTGNFDCCSKCGNAIVAKERLTVKGLVWSGMCQKCYPYDPRKPL